MLLGLTESDAVGAGGAGGGGGGGGAFFLAQAPRARMAPSVTARTNICLLACFTFVPPYDRRHFTPRSDEVRLFPTPVRLRVASGKRQLPKFIPVRQHHPDFFLARAARLEHDMPSVRRPRRRIVAPAVMRKLHPLLAGDIHQVKIERTRISGPVFPYPRQHQKLPIRRP